MAEYKKYNNRPGGSQQRSYGAQGAQQRELYNADCSKCGGKCQVPFRPNGKKPIYCSNCFVRDESRPAFNSFERKEFKPRTSARPSFNTEVPNREVQDLKRQIETMNATLEKLVTVVDTFNRATALTDEIRKHVPEKKAAVEEAPAAPKKKVAKKAVKTAKKK